MGAEFLIHVAVEGLFLVLLIAAPPVLAAFLVGSVAGWIQSRMRIEEPAVSFVPKTLAAFAALALAAPWIVGQLVSFTTLLLEGIPGVGG